MPKEALIVLIVFFVCVMTPLIIVTIISIKNVKQHIEKTTGVHNIEIETGFTFARLILDGKVIDEIKSSHGIKTAKLRGKVEDKNIEVNIGSGFLKPKILVFIDGEKDNDLSNI